MGLIGWIAIGVVVLLLLYGVAVYNRLVRLRALVREGFSGITVQLRRRADLIPNLVETVQGYAGHERETLDSVVAHRGDAVKASSGGVAATAAADSAMTGMLGRLMVVAEAYPDLKANQNFLALQEELTATEGRVAYARQFYNDSVLTYDNKLESFPTVIIAKSFNFEPKEYFEAEDLARTAPMVEF